MGARGKNPERDKLVGLIENNVLKNDPEYQRYSFRSSETQDQGLLDFVFATASEPHTPEAVFDKMRWGGLFVFISKNQQEVVKLSQDFTRKRGFEVDKPPSTTQSYMFNIKLPFLAKKVHYFMARKVLLIPPGSFTDRFSYQVELVKHENPKEGYVVLKQLPDYDYLRRRLEEKFKDADPATIAKRARKLVDKVFPVFITRETALLNILQRDMPKPYNERIPRIIDFEKSPTGFVRRIRMTWLRNGGQPISQLEFAHQSATLLHILHDQVGIVHLDLRLDNFVITDSGVGFIDFGSSVRIGEDLSESQMLNRLFDEIMSTSQIQKTMGRMMETGKVTNPAITQGHQRVDKAADIFFLALQWNDPHGNPDFKDLVTIVPGSPEQKALQKLTEEVLRPGDPKNPKYRTASDLLEGINKIRADLEGK